MPGRAEAALDAAEIEERRLERRQGVVVGEALDGRDRAALGLEREVGARVHGLAVEQHHAGAALGVVAAFLGAGQPDDVAHRREQVRAGLELDRVGDPVHVQRRRDLHALLLARRASSAVSIARPRDHGGHRAPVVGRAADVGDGRRGGRRPPQPQLRSASAPPSLPMSAASASGTRRIVGESAVIAIRASVTVPSVDGDDGRCADDGDLHLPPVLEPEVGAARAVGRSGNLDLDEQLVGLGRRGARARPEVVDRDLASSRRATAALPSRRSR